MIFERAANLRVARFGVAIEQRLGRDDDARDAVSALRRLFLDEGALQRVQVCGGADPLERGDAAAGECLHRLTARIDRLAVDDNLASAALLEAAAELGGRQSEIVAQ